MSDRTLRTRKGCSSQHKQNLSGIRLKKSSSHHGIKKSTYGNPAKRTVSEIFQPTASTSIAAYEVPTTSFPNVNYGNSTAVRKEQRELEPWIKRKFYIVENGGRPSEVYCTDFIHKAKHGSTLMNGKNVRVEDTQCLLRVTDRWREEWNNGVQMPLSRTRQTYQHENTCLFSDVQFETLFHQPKKYVAMNYNKNYVVKNSGKFLTQAKAPLYHYVMDDVDEEWLTNFKPSCESTRTMNGERAKNIDTRTFLDVMNLLEITAYKNIHTKLIEPLKNLSTKDNTDEDADCDICRMPEWEPDDEIVFCDGCNISVHQSCYGIDTLPTEEWLCKVCSHGRNPHPPCIFCPIQGGAMKPTTHLTNSWAHVVCALWIPEVRFGDVENREPITHISEIPAVRWQSKCCVCDTRNGACINCTDPRCDATFHVSCAQRADLILHIEHDNQEYNEVVSNFHGTADVRMVSLCPKHSVRSPYRDKKHHFNKDHLSEITRNFFKYVNTEDICKTLKLLPETVSTIFKYWKWKRGRNKFHPLIEEPVDIKLNTNSAENLFQIASKNGKFKTSTSNQKRRAKDEPSIFDTIPLKKLANDYEKIHELRLNLEKARNLCYMVTRREKLKMMQLEMLRQNVISTGALLLDSSIPLSNRRVDKLLLMWEASARDLSNAESNAKIIDQPKSDVEIPLKKRKTEVEELFRDVVFSALGNRRENRENML